MTNDRSPEFKAVLGLFLPICLIAVSLRVYCRAFLVKVFGLDDWFAVAAMIAFILYCTFAISGIEHGTGKRNSLISTEDFPIGMKWWWACEPVYVLVTMFLKQSIAIFLLRVAVVKTHRLILTVTIIINQIYSAYFLLLFIFQCTPTSHFWNQYRGGKGKCIDPNITVASFYAYSAISCAADWIFSITPIFMVYNLQMDKKTKISVTIMLGFAALCVPSPLLLPRTSANEIGNSASTATIVRIPFISGMRDTSNFLYATIDVAIWSTVETGIGIATSSLATLRPLLRKIISSTGGRTTDHGATSGRRTGGRPWIRGNYQSGYHRKISNYEGGGDIAMGNKHMGVTTVVATGTKGQELDDMRDGGNQSRTGSVTALKDARGWNHSTENKLHDGSSDEYNPSSSDYDHGIRKTVQVTQT
ncbi:hypothetical protein B0O99DRAFT_592039 [Bisporella sp. PMI_857]|nr:hypothetical protein B0O99DRAFT_592039 [Bisporella sp. PMI_857]